MVSSLCNPMVTLYCMISNILCLSLMIIVILFYTTPKGCTDFEISPGIFRNQLPGYVPTQCNVRFLFELLHVFIRFPIPVCRVRVRTSRRCVRHPSCGNDPGSFPGPLSPLHDGSHSVLVGHRRRTVR